MGEDTRCLPATMCSSTLSSRSPTSGMCCSTTCPARGSTRAARSRDGDCVVLVVDTATVIEVHADATFANDPELRDYRFWLEVYDHDTQRQGHIASQVSRIAGHRGWPYTHLYNLHRVMTAAPPPASLGSAK